MADKKFSAVLTRAGTDKMAAAALSGVTVGFSQMAVGDGGGVLPVPAPEQTGLINELYRSTLNRLSVVDEAANIIEAEMIMPPQVGGFWLRELALYDESGVCLAVGNMPESYKPLLAQGAGRHQVIRMWLAVSSTSSVTLTDNPAVVLATVEEVRKVRSETKDYTDEVAGEIGKAIKDSASNLDKSIRQAIDAAVAKARKEDWEADNPVGDIRLFTRNIDPNKRWPWSTWVYLGEDKTLRLAKKNGSDLMEAGGSDSITIGKDNLPPVKIAVTGETDEHNTGELKTRDTDLGTKKTKAAGGHKHKGGLGDPGESWGQVWAGTDNQGGYSRNYTSDEPDHEHEMVLGGHAHVMDAIRHKHKTKGKTDNLGSGSAISTVNSYVRVMAWYRTA